MGFNQPFFKGRSDTNIKNRFLVLKRRGITNNTLYRQQISLQTQYLKNKTHQFTKANNSDKSQQPVEFAGFKESTSTIIKPKFNK